MNDKQLGAARDNMLVWLSGPHELGKAPNKIECAGQFDYNAMRYFIFKFKPGIFGKWLVGVCGGFEGDDLNPCGHTFSDMQPYDENTAQNECVRMIEKVMAYWKAQAKRFES